MPITGTPTGCDRCCLCGGAPVCGGAAPPYDRLCRLCGNKIHAAVTYWISRSDGDPVRLAEKLIVERKQKKLRRRVGSLDLPAYSDAVLGGEAVREHMESVLAAARIAAAHAPVHPSVLDLRDAIARLDAATGSAVPVRRR